MELYFDPILGKMRVKDSKGGAEFDPNGIYPGLTAGGLTARESDAIVDLRTSFIFRSAGGNESITTGAAKIASILGNVVDGIPCTPTHFKAVGFNAFNPANVMNKAIAADGSITDSDDHKVAYVHVIAGQTGAGRNNGYLISSKENDTLLVNRVAFVAADPTTAESATVLSATAIDSTRSAYIPPTDGWLLIDCYNAQLANMCVHLAWSYNPQNWLAYDESVIELPKVHDWGLGKAGDKMDEINFLDQQIIIRTNRTLLSDLHWTEHHQVGESAYTDVSLSTEAGEIIAVEENTITVGDTVYTRDAEHDTVSAYAWTNDDVTVYTAHEIPTAPVYSYTTQDLQGDIKVSTANLYAYGLPSSYTFTVSADGTLTLITFATQDSPASYDTVYLYYEIANEIIKTEELNPIYAVDDFGTEEFIGTAVAPTYATFFYMPNLYDGIRQMLNNDQNMRSYTVPFGTSSVMAQDVNVEAPIIITKVMTYNVATLRITTGSYVQTLIPLTDGAATVAIPVALDALVTWEITRITNNENASIGVRYEF